MNILHKAADLIGIKGAAMAIEQGVHGVVRTLSDLNGSFSELRSEVSSLRSEVRSLRQQPYVILKGLHTVPDFRQSVLSEEDLGDIMKQGLTIEEARLVAKHRNIHGAEASQVKSSWGKRAKYESSDSSAVAKFYIHNEYKLLEVMVIGAYEITDVKVGNYSLYQAGTEFPSMHYWEVPDTMNATADVGSLISVYLQVPKSEERWG